MKKVVLLLFAFFMLTACSNAKNELTLNEAKKILNLSDVTPSDESAIEDYNQDTYTVGYCDIRLTYKEGEENPLIAGLEINTNVENPIYQKQIDTMKDDYDINKNQCYENFVTILKNKYVLGSESQKLIDEMNTQDELVEKKLGAFTFNYLFPVYWSLFDTKIYNDNEFLFN